MDNELKHVSDLEKEEFMAMFTNIRKVVADAGVTCPFCQVKVLFLGGAMLAEALEEAGERRVH
jgi:hypothetical protein